MASNTNQKRFTKHRECGHCGCYAPMIIVAGFSDWKYVNPTSEGYDYKYGECYDLLQCQSCAKVELRNHFYEEPEEQEGNQRNYKTLYPEAPTVPQGLPEKVLKEYMAAFEARHSPPNAYGVMLGRVLEQVCIVKKQREKCLVKN